MVKKKYSYSRKGKYYTYAKINRMLSQYAKFKMSVSLALKWVNQNAGGFLFRLDAAVDDPFPQSSLGVLFGACTVYDGLRQMYSAFKVRGVLLETMPYNLPMNFTDDAGNNWIPYNGMVGIGLFTEGGGANAQERLDRRKTYRNISDSDKGLILDTVQRQRKYCSFNQYDFTNFPNGNLERSVPYVPLFLHCNYQDLIIPGNFVNRPEWIIKLTFYVTCKDKIL